MSALQRSTALLKRFIQLHCKNLTNYATVAESTIDNMEDHMVWIDMEMTGLNINTDHIMEVACLITDAQLKIISNEFRVVIKQPEHILQSMNKWCIKQHSKTGLTEECRNSEISLEATEQELLKFVKEFVPEGKCPMAGNSVYMDRLFLRKYMPLVDSYLHYRIVDTSTIKELVRRWNPEVHKSAPKKSFAHRALDDIRESIKELEFYKTNVFRIDDNQR